MTAKELIDFLSTVPPDHAVLVALSWQGETVLSGISSACINGLTVQLNEDDFDKQRVEYYQVPAVYGQAGTGKTCRIEDE